MLYDGLCPICVAEIRFLEFLQRNMKPGRVNFVDISLDSYDGAKHGNVSYEMAMEVMHVIDEKEQVRFESVFHAIFSRVLVGFFVLTSVPVERDLLCANRSTGGSPPSR